MLQGWGAAPLFTLAVAALLVGTAFMFLILQQYNRIRPGALASGLLAAIALGVVFAREYWQYSSLRVDNIDVGLDIIRLGLWVLGLTWVAIGVCYLLAVLVSGCALARAPKCKRWRLFRGTWTAHVTLGLAAALVLTLNLAVWSAVIRFVGQPLLGQCEPACGTLTLAAPVQTAKTLIVEHAGWGFHLALYALAAIFIAAVWGLAPSILAEMRPPQGAQDRQRAKWLGAWLSRGLSGMAIVAFPVGMALATGVLISLQQKSSEDISGILWATGLLVFALVAGKQWISGLGVVLSIALEIDNYMREHPTESSPRARIAERFASLLRTIGQNQRHGRDGYDGVVIIAHSQGTVVAADLLRFLRKQRQEAGDAYEPQLRWLETTPIRLFTMGSPLRQLYGWCFPNLYEWAMPPADWPETAPAASWLGEKMKWLNVYRSGDYVGRCLWVAHSDPAVWTRRPASSPSGLELHVSHDGTQAEGCIGEGAHTHYWDATAPDVARLLAYLLADSL